jgi:hypothetical protein
VALVRLTIAHALHSSHDDAGPASRSNRVRAQLECLHRRSAHLVHCRAGGTDGQPTGQGGLACRRLANSGGQHAAEHELFHFGGADTRTLHGRLDRQTAQLRCSEARQSATQRSATNWRARISYDPNFLLLLLLLLRCRGGRGGCWSGLSCGGQVTGDLLHALHRCAHD